MHAQTFSRVQQSNHSKRPRRPILKTLQNRPTVAAVENVQTREKFETSMNVSDTKTKKNYIEKWQKKAKHKNRGK